MIQQVRLVYEVESAINRSPKKGESGRYAVYVPGAAVIGTFDESSRAHEVASSWLDVIPEVVVVDRGLAAVAP
jgi:hypothetical protein